MNFQALKWMVDNLVQTYSCPDCSSGVTEDYVDIMWTAGQNINIEVACPKCEKHSIIRAQIVALELPIQDIQVKVEELEKAESFKMKEMQNKLENIEKYKWHIEDLKIDSENKKTLIKDSQIVELNKNLKSANFSIENLFNK